MKMINLSEWVLVGESIPNACFCFLQVSKQAEITKLHDEITKVRVKIQQLSGLSEQFDNSGPSVF